jgi:arsenite-transporting ATPase
VAPDCWAQQLDALERMESSWGEIRSWLVEVMDWAGLSAMEAEELAILPGFEELVALLEIDRLAGCGRYDVVVVDCAPTAESIRLLSLPDLLSWYMDRLFPASRRLTRLVRPVLARVSDLPVASGEVFDAVERFHHHLEEVRRLLTDAERTSVRLVLTPERMSVAEARRTHTYLALFGYHVDAVVANRVLPPEGRGAFLTSMRAAQRVQLDCIDEAFAPLPVLRAAHAPGEVLGAGALLEHGRGLWAARDPLDDLCPGRGLELDHRDGVAVLSIELPRARGRGRPERHRPRRGRRTLPAEPGAARLAAPPTGAAGTGARRSPGGDLRRPCHRLRPCHPAWCNRRTRRQDALQWGNVDHGACAIGSCGSNWCDGRGAHGGRGGALADRGA